MCASTEEAKNLAKAETRHKRAAGATRLSEGGRNRIFEYAWWMKKEGYAESTIVRRARILKTLVKRGAHLLDAESVKETIAKEQDWSLKTKSLAVEAYSCFLKMQGGTWKPPKYKPPKRLPFIPSEEEIDQLIAACNRKTIILLQLLKETGMRSGEAWMLRWTDLNFKNNTVTVTPEKGGDPRVLKISSKLIGMLNTLPRNRPKVFKGSLRHFARSYRRQRKRIAKKLNNERIKEITFHTLRHFKATMEYHKTKNILHVMRMLGHRNIQNTLIYTRLMEFEGDEFHSAVAKTADEAQRLIEEGFEYVCDFDHVKLFRKRS